MNEFYTIIYLIYRSIWTSDNRELVALLWNRADTNFRFRSPFPSQFRAAMVRFVGQRLLPLPLSFLTFLWRNFFASKPTRLLHLLPYMSLAFLLYIPTHHPDIFCRLVVIFSYFFMSYRSPKNRQKNRGVPYLFPTTKRRHFTCLNNLFLSAHKLWTVCQPMANERGK